MTRSAYCWLAIALAVTAGCRSRTDLVEAELRAKDRQLRETRAELDRVGNLNEAYEHTIRGGPPASCPTGGTVAAIKEIQVARGTGGIDEDNCPGDEGLLVVIVPKDSDASAIKVGGTARITALQITPEGLKLPLSTWDVSSAHLRRNWKSGLISTGYYVSLPWIVIPSCEKLRIVVTFQATDGGTYESEKDVQIRLGNLPRPAPGGPLPLPSPAPASGLPPPTPANGPPLTWQASKR